MHKPAELGSTAGDPAPTLALKDVTKWELRLGNKPPWPRRVSACKKERQVGRQEGPRLTLRNQRRLLGGGGLQMDPEAEQAILSSLNHSLFSGS